MNLFVRKSLSFTSSPCFHPKNPTFLLQFFSSASASQNPARKSDSISDYLITSCGFSPQRAAKVLKRLGDRRRFPSNPESVRHFFRHHGFTDTNIQSIISNDPNILWADVNKTLKPNFKTFSKLVDVSDSDLRRFVVSNPRVLANPVAFSRLEFWKTFLNDDMKKLLKVFTRNPRLITRDIDKNIAPKIALLKDYGLSSTDIGMVLGRGSGLIQKSTASIELSLKRVHELGFPRGSAMFLLGLASIGSIKPEILKAKMEIFKCFGWSESMFFNAIKKFPNIVLLSEQNIREKMDFLVERAGCMHSYIAQRPAILGYSREKRLLPRYRVWKVLKSNEWVGRDWDIYSIMCISERKFFEKIILRYKEIVLNLHETYIAAFANKTSH